MTSEYGAERGWSSHWGQFTVTVHTGMIKSEVRGGRGRS